MKNLDRLLDLLHDEPKVKRFKELEDIINNDNVLQQQYKELKDYQKLMVQKKHNNTSDYPTYKKAYETKRSELENHLVLSEYLDLIEEINEDLQMIVSIIEEEIKTDL